MRTYVLTVDAATATVNGLFPLRKDHLQRILPISILLVIGYGRFGFDSSSDGWLVATVNHTSRLLFHEMRILLLYFCSINQNVDLPKVSLSTCMGPRDSGGRKIRVLTRCRIEIFAIPKAQPQSSGLCFGNLDLSSSSPPLVQNASSWYTCHDLHNRTQNPFSSFKNRRENRPVVLILVIIDVLNLKVTFLTYEAIDGKPAHHQGGRRDQSPPRLTSYFRTKKKILFQGGDMTKPCKSWESRGYLFFVLRLPLEYKRHSILFIGGNEGRYSVFEDKATRDGRVVH
ncbi:uncharacterized protein H6S33_004819 [Morchella sextelata]|uniref:uncharacterized protein n=1 Tax=Morchella sextelata TaxID=1174677 RepID=UPI001D048E52|nr:uncharacterized protein H6S33_004819 [Morchella sextelata]KAH0605597.1 hypothetical protein H6S33_004819 [Morchella sextelata]